jgi:peptide/nickel transport system substrate-binding protein
MSARNTGIALGLILTLSACDREQYGSETLTEALIPVETFCETVLPRVESYISRMEAEHPVTDPARYGGTAVVGSIGDFADGMNHFVSSNYDASQHQEHVNLMSLVSYDAKLVPQPYLAESWEVDDEANPTTLTFHLRDDVYWHDGERTDAEDVAFTYRVITDTLTAYPNAAFWDHYVRGAEGVEVVDQLTVRVRLRPHAEYMDPWTRVGIMPQHLLDGVPVTEYKQHPYGTQCPVGNGPFVFVEHRPQESWTFKANPAFSPSLGGRPFLDRYVFRVIPEQATLLTDLLTENIDVFIAPRPEQAPQILKSPKHELLHYVSRQYTFVAWNARRPQFADVRVRRAMTLGTNRHQIVEAQLKGYGRAANTGVPPFHWAYDPTKTDLLRYNPAEARRLLDEAGWTDRNGDGVRENADGVQLAFTLNYNQGNQQRQDVAEIMQAQLGQIGVRVQPQVMEFGTMVNMIQDPARDYDAVVFGWVTEFKLDDADLFHSARIGQPYAFSGTKNPEMDRYLDTLQLVVKREDAIPLWRAYEKLVLEEQPYTWFWFPERLDGLAKRLRDVEMDARGEWINIRKWWIPPEERREAVASR